MFDLKALLTKILNCLIVEDITNKITFDSAWTEIYKKAYKIGNVVYFGLEGYVSGTFVAGTQYTMATIASGYRPRIYMPVQAHITNSSYQPTGISNSWVWGDGSITVRPQNTNGRFFFISGTYVI